MDVYTLEPGTAPLLISLPHEGSFIPREIRARMTPVARRSPDTDWHVARLYTPLARKLGASVLFPSASRYVIDLNRPSDGHALYPGRRETGLVPLIGFDGEPLYRDPADEPDAAETERRINDYWQPYHRALEQELARIKQRHGRAVLWEGHSIRSRVPMLFDGELPTFNLGTAEGASCGSDLQRRLADVLAAQERDFVVNGRFKGGYITRRYGQPREQVQAIQLELAQHCYMDEASFAYDEERAPRVQETIEKLLRACLI